MKKVMFKLAILAIVLSAILVNVRLGVG